MSVTFLVSKLVTSNLVRAEQPENIQRILVTFLVSKLVTSNFVRAEHSKNMPPMSVTFLVSNLVTSRSVRDMQPSNIQLISVTSEVLRFSMPEIRFKALQFTNQWDVVLGRKSLNEVSNFTLARIVSLSKKPPAQTGKVSISSICILSMPNTVPVREAFFAS